MSWDEGLTEKQRNFVAEYVETFNATKAAIAAGYSEKTAYSMGHQNLKKLEIKTAIREFQKEMQVEISPARLVEEYINLAMVDPADFYDKNGDFLPVPKMPRRARMALQGTDLAVSSIGDNETIVTKKIKWQDRKSVLDSLARSMGMFIDKQEVTGSLEHTVRTKEETDAINRAAVKAELTKARKASKKI